MTDIIKLLRIYNGVKNIAGAWAGRKCLGHTPDTQSVPTPAPTGPSIPIKGIDVNWSTLIKDGENGDNWPSTWAADGNQYIISGDGKGLHGHNDYRSCWVSTLVSHAPGTFGHDLWSGDGKYYGCVAVDNALYMIGGPGSMETAMRTTYMHKFTLRPFRHVGKVRLWDYRTDVGIAQPSIVQFGQNNEYAPDDCVYIMGPRFKKHLWNITDNPSEMLLIRVHKHFLMHPNKYEYWTGRGWSRDIRKMRAVVHGYKFFVPGVCYIPGLNRFLMLSWCEIHKHGSKPRQTSLGVWEAERVTGTWRKVQTISYFGKGHIYPDIFYWSLLPKWWSADGKTGVMAFSGRKNDRLNMVEVVIKT